MRKFTAMILAALPLAMMAQWSSNPLVPVDVSNPRNSVYEWDFGVNSDNSITTIFSTPNKGKIEMWYNTIDADGKSIFADGAQMLASEESMTWTQFGDICYHDSEGNMVVVYQSFSNCIEQGVTERCPNFDVYKISPAGELLWEEPVDLHRGDWSEEVCCAVSIAELEDGSYMIAWCDYPATQIGRIFIERISAEGELLWDEPLCVAEDNVPYQYPYLESAGDNQVVLVYVKGTNQDVMVRKIDFDGSSVWGQDVTAYRGGFPSVPVWTLLEVMSDGNGGVIIGWRDDRYFSEFEKSYVSHILTDGSYAYASGIEGEAVAYCETLRCFEPTMLYDEVNKCLYTLRRDTSSGQSWQRLAIQKMSASGELLWGSEGIEMFPLTENTNLAYFDLQFAEDGNVVAFYMEQLTGMDVVARAHKFNAETGEAMWEQDVVFTPDTEMRSSLKASKLIDGKYWVVMWEDSRYLEGDPEASAERKHLYMQRINIDGTLGDPAAVELVAEDKVEVRVSGNAIIAPEGAEVYSLDGVRCGVDNLSAGIYVVRCGERATKVIVK